MRPAGVTLENWQTGPANRWAFLHMDQMVPTGVISRGEGAVLDLPEGEPASLPGLDAFLERSYTDGFLVLRGREVVVERYLNGLEPSTPHALMSVSKSLASAVLGQYVVSGQVRVDEPVLRYLPELAGTGYGDATVQQLLDMTAGVEDSDDDGDRVAGWLPLLPGDPPDSYAYVTTLPKTAEHGRAFAYCNTNLDVLGWVLERITGRGCLDVLSSDLWSRIGAEHDAYATVDRAGFPSLCGGISVTLRDLARFGRAVLDAGLAADGDETVLPPAWIADVRRGGDRELAAEFMGEVHPGGSYRDLFWITGDARGTFYGAGGCGQFLWLDPTSDVVIAKLSTQPTGDDRDAWAEEVERLGEICRALE